MFLLSSVFGGCDNTDLWRAIRARGRRRAYIVIQHIDDNDCSGFRGAVAPLLGCFTFGGDVIVARTAITHRRRHTKRTIAFRCCSGCDSFTRTRIQRLSSVVTPSSSLVIFFFQFFFARWNFHTVFPLVRQLAVMEFPNLGHHCSKDTCKRLGKWSHDE